ncbi:hypothetical protein [Streptomyces sp. NRRL S-1813]|uniref:hypothetical protein n=1 Tax=Streptomyces sp. NRRL S-1813 TaxID=1463888 RepID=UPI0004C8BEA4|nr:hypothetical protein [Streptomyces sp. NRRL S-1813]
MSWKKVSDVDADAHSATGSAPTAGSALRRGRRVAAASLVAVAALSLTACGSGGDDTKASTKVSSSPDPSRLADEAAALGDVANEPRAKDKSTPSRKPSAPGKAGGDSGGASDDKTDRDGGTGGADHTGGTDAGGGSAAGAGSASQGKGVSGTWNGVLKYLAPGKMTVAPDSGPEQGFFVGSQTKSLGAAAMCASNGNVTMDESGYGTSPCTDAQLEEAAKMNSLEVRVTVEGGVATKIVEHYHP